jgi:protein-L-isoaspartate O-methyltransferase
MKNIDMLSKTYLYFSKAEGNQHIASEFAILKLQELIESFKVKSILEIGLGIGAIAGSVLSVNKDIIYTGTESNEFCLNALKQNIGDNLRRITICHGIADLDQSTMFDLIIIDGKDLALQQVNRLLSSKGIIAIEGDRKEQQEDLQKIFPNHLIVHCISRIKNKDYSPFPSNQWQGGIKIIFVNPTFLQKIWWLRERISTKWKYLMVR